VRCCPDEALVNINPACRLHELEYALNKSGVGVLVIAGAFKDRPAAFCGERGVDRQARA
jgi:hypothetical protein